MKKFFIILLSVMIVLMSIGCDQKVTGLTEVPTEGPTEVQLSDAPALPPEATMSIPDMGGDGGGTKRSAKPIATYSKINIGIATLAVGYWTGVVKLALIKPVALFILTHSVNPVPLPDNSGWQWSVSNCNYTATLISKEQGDSIYWAMNVTGGGLTNYTWFDGTSTKDGKSGRWTFYNVSSSGGTNAAVYKFTYELTDSTEDVKVQVVDKENDAFKSYLQWIAEGNMRTFRGYNSQKEETIIIEWNMVTEAGSIKNLRTGNQFCWDTKNSNHRDIACN